MAVVISVRGKVTDFEVWTDTEAAGGSLVPGAAISNVLTGGTNEIIGLEETQNIETREHVLDVEVRFDSGLTPAFIVNRVIRLTFESGEFKEFRIDSVLRVRDVSGGKKVRVEANSISVDLTRRSGMVLQPYATGVLDPYVQLYGVDPLAVLQWVLRNSHAPSWIQAGTVSFTKTIDVAFDRFTPQRAIEEIVARIEEREGVPAYLQFLRDGTSSYKVQIVTDPAPGSDTVPISFADNELSLEERTTHEKFGNYIYVSSGGEPSAALSIADAMWIVAGVSGNNVTFRAEDEPFGEDDQLNTKYLEMPDGTTRIQVVDTVAATHTVTLASAPPVSVGERVRFVEDAAGTDLQALPSPSGMVAPHGEVTQVLERPDIPPINNWIPSNAYVTEFSGGPSAAPDGFTAIGTPTLVQETGDAFSRFGLSSLKMTAAPGHGVKYGPFRVDLRSDKALLTAMSMLWVTLGSIRFEMHDVSDPTDVRIWYPETADNKARSPSTEFWSVLSIFPGAFSFWERAQKLGQNFVDLEFHWIAEEDNQSSTVVYIDAIQLIRRPIPVPSFYDGSAGNALWWVARDYLKAFNTPQKFYQVGFVDKDRMGITVNQEVVPGSFASLTDTGLGVPTNSKRILQSKWDHLKPGKTEIELEQIPAEFADRFLGRPRAPIRDFDPTTQKPACPQGFRIWHAGDFEAEWQRAVGASRYELRRPGAGATPFERWLNGDHLAYVDGTSWVLKDGAKIDTGVGNPPILPGDIKEAMIEAYNADGVPSECYQLASVIVVSLPFACPNLAPPDALTLHCDSLLGPGMQVIHTFQPVLASDHPEIQPGVTKVALCHEGSAETATAATLNAYYAARLANQVGAARGALSRYNPGGVNLSAVVVAFGHNQWFPVACDTRPQASNQLVGWRHSDTIAMQRFTDTQLFGQVGIPTITAGLGGSGNLGGFGSGGTPGNKCKFRRGLWSSGDDIVFSSLPAGASIEIKRISGQTGGSRYGPRNVGSYTDGDMDGIVTAANFIGFAPYDQITVWPGAVGSGTPLATLNNMQAVPGNRYQWDGSTLLLTTNALVADRFSGFLSGDLGTLLLVMAGTPTINTLGELELEEGDKVVVNMPASDTMYSQAEFLRPGTAYPSPEIGVLGTGAAQTDLRVTLRAEFRDATGAHIASTVGSGLYTNDVNTFATEQVLAGAIWPSNAVDLVIQQVKIGTDDGDYCSTNVQLNTGTACCTPTDPIPDLPPVNVDCLLSGNLSTYNLGDCSNRTGIGMLVSGQIQKTDLCPDIDSGLWGLILMFFEQHDPVNSPGSFALVYTHPPVDLSLFLPPGGLAIGQQFSYLVTLPITDQVGTSGLIVPPAGSVRASDGTAGGQGNPQNHLWYVRIILRHSLNRRQTGGFDTAAVPIGPYGWCP